MKYENTPEDLRKAYESFNVKHEFKPGMIVRWKEGMCTDGRKGPFIVMEVGDDDMGVWRRDLIIGYIDNDGDFMLSAEDSRYFEPMTDAMIA